MTFEELRNELGKLGLKAIYVLKINQIFILKEFAKSFIWFPFDGHIEDIEAPNRLGMLDDDTATMLRKYISLYLSTPIHKRANYTEYYLKLNEKFNKEFGYLRYVCDSKKYSFDCVCQDDENFHSHFTNTEIEKMPKEILAMIQSGVLTKVPVNEEVDISEKDNG